MVSIRKYTRQNTKTSTAIVVVIGVAAIAAISTALNKYLSEKN